MKLQRTPILSVIAFLGIGVVVGLIVQFARSGQGLSPLVPPVSLPATLVVIAGVLIVLAVILHRRVRAIGETPEQARGQGPVNPFHAVRLLAGAKAAQYAGALFGGFGGGLALQLLTRSVMPKEEIWWPMILVLGAGVALAVCGMIAEWLCRVPPDDTESGRDVDGGARSSPSDSPA